MSRINTLMLIDDDDVFVFLTSKAIEQTNLVNNIRVFDNGLDALTFFEENKHNEEILPDIILLDLSMPIINGWQFLDKYIKINSSIRKKIAIYICSSSISPDDVARAKTVNVITDYLIKPIVKEKLLDIIKSY